MHKVPDAQHFTLLNVKWRMDRFGINQHPSSDVTRTGKQVLYSDAFKGPKNRTIHCRLCSRNLVSLVRSFIYYMFHVSHMKILPA